MEPRKLQGPPKVLAENPALLAVSLSLSGAAAGVFATRAARSRGWSRLGWAMLFAIQAVVFVGMLGLAEGRGRRIAA